MLPSISAPLLPLPIRLALALRLIQNEIHPFFPFFRLIVALPPPTCLGRSFRVEPGALLLIEDYERCVELGE
jgi:hypothetical protein